MVGKKNDLLSSCVNNVAIHLSGSKSGRKRSGEKRKIKVPIETHTVLEMLTHHVSVDVKQAVGCTNLVVTGALGPGQPSESHAHTHGIHCHCTGCDRQGDRWRMSKTEPWMKRRRRKNRQAEKGKKRGNQENESLKHFKRKIYLTFQSSSFLVHKSEVHMSSCLVGRYEALERMQMSGMLTHGRGLTTNVSPPPFCIASEAVVSDPWEERTFQETVYSSSVS